MGGGMPERKTRMELEKRPYNIGKRLDFVEKDRKIPWWHIVKKDLKD